MYKNSASKFTCRNGEVNIVVSAHALLLAPAFLCSHKLNIENIENKTGEQCVSLV